MTEMQLKLPAGIPKLLCFDKVDGQVNRIEADLREFHSTTGAHMEAFETL